MVVWGVNLPGVERAHSAPGQVVTEGGGAHTRTTRRLTLVLSSTQTTDVMGVAGLLEAADQLNPSKQLNCATPLAEVAARAGQGGCESRLGVR